MRKTLVSAALVLAAMCFSVSVNAQSVKTQDKNKVEKTDCKTATTCQKQCNGDKKQQCSENKGCHKGEKGQCDKAKKCDKAKGQCCETKKTCNNDQKKKADCCNKQKGQKNCQKTNK